jgi:hypothetical protein
MPWSWAAWATTFFKSSSSVAALAVKEQSGTISAQAMYLALSFAGADIFRLLCEIFRSFLEMPGAGAL